MRKQDSLANFWADTPDGGVQRSIHQVTPSNSHGLSPKRARLAGGDSVSCASLSRVGHSNALKEVIPAQFDTAGEYDRIAASYAVAGAGPYMPSWHARQQTTPP